MTTTDRWAWTALAACRDLDVDLFFADRGDTHATWAARAVCLTCPVQPDCLQFALTHNERFGMWGGVSERGRRQIRNAQRQNRRVA